MKEALFILLIVLILLGFTAYRYRRQLTAGYQVWKMFQGLRKGTLGSHPEREPEKSGNLVSCSRCGTWVPESKAMKLGRSVNYCSPACMERSAVSS